MDGVRIVRVTDRAGLEAYVRVQAEISPEDARTVAEIDHDDATYPGATRFLALAGDQVVGAAGVARIFVFPPEFNAFWCDLGVVAAHRGSGTGTALHAAASAVARDAGKVALHIPCTEERPAAIAWLTRRGYGEYERSRAVALDLTRIERPAVEPPRGVEIVRLSDRPDLLEPVYAIAHEVLADIPGLQTPLSPGTLEEFRRGCVDNPGVPPGAFLIALVDGAPAGYASLLVRAARPGVAFHEMTGTLRVHRRRGVAGALKRALIGWAIDSGLRRLETENDVDNAPMRSINARLGYEPMPDFVIMRGPLT